MSKLILVGLVVAWAVMLTPDAIRFISKGRRGDTMRSFSSQITSLGSMNRSARQGSIDSLARRSSPEKVQRTVSGGQGTTSAIRAPHATRQPAGRIGVSGHGRVDPRRRRQDVLVVLGSAVILTLLATVAFGGIFLVLHVVVDIALIAYLVALAQVLNLFGGAGHQVAHGPARRTVARHSQAGHTQGSALPTSKPAQRLAPQPIPATVRVQPVPVAARNATR